MSNQDSNMELLRKIQSLERLVEKYQLREESLVKERNFNKILIDASPAFCVSISVEGKTLMMNEVMLVALGFSENEVIGKGYLESFVPDSDHEPLNRDFEKRLVSPKPTINENYIIAKDGKQILVEWHGRSIFKSDGEVDFFFGVGIDISERRRAEKKLKIAFSEIQRLKESYEAENIYLRQEIKITHGHEKIIGQSQVIKNVLAKIELVANTESSVLILGETGTGKELVADALHNGGLRSSGPFIKVNCSALTETILESELFGHVKGAFSGAVKDKVGRIQAAEGGTLFLDEIGEISHQIQVKLLRFLDNKEYERVGEASSNKADVRIVAATNAELRDKVNNGTFRSDLYYRLNIMSVQLPSLREREGDISLLVNHFLIHYAQIFHREFQGVDSSVMEIFLNYPWHGNVRELKHTIEHACLLCKGKILLVEHLPLEFQKPLIFAENKDNNKNNEIERIVDALAKSNWQKSQAARLLGIHRSTLYRMMDRYNIMKR